MRTQVLDYISFDVHNNLPSEHAVCVCAMHILFLCTKDWKLIRKNYAIDVEINESLFSA